MLCPDPRLSLTRPCLGTPEPGLPAAPPPLPGHPRQPEPCHTVQPKPPPGACPLPRQQRPEEPRPGTALSQRSGGLPQRDGSSLKRMGTDGLTEQKTPQASRAQSPGARLLRAALLTGSSVNTSVPSRQLPRAAEQGGHVAGAVTPGLRLHSAPSSRRRTCCALPSLLPGESSTVGTERRSGHSQNCPKIWPITFPQCSQRCSHTP